MLKVFGRKKSAPVQPDPPPPPPPAPARVLVSRPRQLGSAPAEQPPPLYARFATRGESFDSSTVGSLKSVNKTRPGLPEPQDSTDDLRSEYAKAVASSRIYGNDSVTRFGSGAELPSPNSSKDEPSPVIVTKKRTPAPSRLGSNDPSSSAQPSTGPSRSASGPVAPTAPRLVTRRQASATNHQPQNDPWDDDLQPPRAPALYTRGSSSSTSTVNSVVQSPISSYEDELSRSPPKLGVVVKKEKSLPVPPSGLSTPAASRPVSIVSSTTTITAPVKVAPSAASLVHPAFKRSLPSSGSTMPASALVHPSQRLRSASSTAASAITELASSPQTMEPPVQPPVVSKPAVVKKVSTSSSVPVPTPEPEPIPEPVPVPETSPTPPPQPRVIKTSAAKQRPASPVTPVVPKRATAQPSPPPAAARTPSPTSAPPSAHKDPILASVKRLSRRLSAEFGTYDIAAARKERERLANGSAPSKDRDLPPTPPTVSRSPSPTKMALKRASMVIAHPSTLTGVLKGLVKDERDKREAGPPNTVEEHKVARSEKKRQTTAPVDLPTPPFSNDESSDGGKPDKGKGKEVVREPSVPASLERSDTAESGASSSRESRSRVTSAETIAPPVSQPPIPHQSTPEPRPASAFNMTQLTSQASSVSSANSSMFSAAMTENTKRTSVSVNEPRNSLRLETRPPQEEAALPPGQVKRQSWYAANAEEEMILAPVKIRKKRALPKPGEIVTSLDGSLSAGPSSATPTSARSTTQPSSSRPLPSPLAQASSRDRTDSFGDSRPRVEPTRKASRPLPSLPQNPTPPADAHIAQGVTPVSPHPSHAGSGRPDGASHRSQPSVGSIPSSSSPPPEQPKYYPLDLHLLHPDLLPPLLNLLSFREALPLFSVNMTLKRMMEETPEIREAVLERYLGESVGYRSWSTERMGKRKEPSALTLRDLNSYMRGISLPLHHYSTVADNFLTALAASTATSANASRTPVPKHLTNQVRMMASSTRAYSKVVIRLRAQAEAEEAHMPPPPPSLMTHDNGSRGRVGARGQHRMPATGPGTCPPTSGPYQGLSRRSPSPAFSFTSYDRNGPASYGPGPMFQPSIPAVSTTPGKFRSPLYRAGHAPLLRVFVPSPEGAWLSDQSVIECERELKRAGLIPLLKVGDVVHDLAAGDEANTGRLIWDGNYLIDLDYSYSPLGEIPKYIDSLAFPPSYFHKIVRSTGNPIVYLDLAPFAADIATHLQLLQDRVQTETPQGGHHSVVRWVHRARFRIRPGAPVSYDAPPIVGPDGQSYIRLIDAGWHGIVVIDAEGTNEGLADLQGRIGNAVTLFPTKTLTGGRVPPAVSGGKSVFRLLRDKSRPGEIWLRCVREKERLQ
ncbi:hypothetical protein FS837_011191 [Tulasnella sp. UAMH 9824]|nr:hypothetical protein FS837_011191 [Tulasnella sp. UAMH 9824]